MAAADHTRVSVIIPALNEAGSIVAVLERLQSLRERGHEVIVVDGGSRDSTRQLCTGRCDRLLDAARGRARQMQAGLDIATGDVIWFLHADTLAPADADRQILAGLARSGKTWGRFDVSFANTAGLLALVPFFMNLRSRLSGIATGDQGIFATRRALEACGGLPDIVLMEDIALSKSLRRTGRPLALRSRLCTSDRRWRRHGVARTILRMWCLRLAYFAGVSPDRLSRYYS